MLTVSGVAWYLLYLLVIYSGINAYVAAREGDSLAQAWWLMALLVQLLSGISALNT